MRLQRKSLIGIVFIFAICLAFACTYSAFAQCDDGGVLCPGGGWCCETIELCENPEESSCYPTDGTTFCPPLYPIDCGDFCCPSIFPFCCVEEVCYGCCFDPGEVMCWGEDSPCVSPKVLDNDEVKIDVLREMRDTRMASTELGTSLIGLYYEHTGEISDILLADEELLVAAANVVNEIVEKALSLNNNGKVNINQELVESVVGLANVINEKASPGLKKAIKQVKREIKRGEIFRQLGITIND